MGRVRPDARQGDVLGLHRRWAGHHRGRPGAARGRQRRAGSVRGGRVRVEHRAGRQGLRQRHAARRGFVLRQARRHARGAAKPRRNGARPPGPAAIRRRRAVPGAVVVLLDGAAVADADHDAVGQLRCAATGTARTPGPRPAPRSTRRGTPPWVWPAARGRTRSAAARRGRAPSPSRRPRRAGSPRWPSATVSSAASDCGVGELACGGRIRDDRCADPPAARTASATGTWCRRLGRAQRARGERPQLRKAAQQGGLARAGAAGDHQRIARIQPHVERVDEPHARRRAHLDIVELHRTVDARHRGQ